MDTVATSDRYPITVSDEDVNILSNELDKADTPADALQLYEHNKVHFRSSAKLMSLEVMRLAKFKKEGEAKWMDSSPFIDFTTAVTDGSTGYLAEITSWTNEELITVFKALAEINIDQPFAMLAACLPERLMGLSPKELTEYLELLARTPEVVSDDLLTLVADELSQRKWQGGFTHREINSSMSSVLALSRATRTLTQTICEIFAAAADTVANMPPGKSYFSLALDSLTIITAAPGQGIPGATALLERLTREGVGQLNSMSTSELSQMASSILRRPSSSTDETTGAAAAADNLAEAIAEEVLRRDILLFTPKEVSELLAAFGGGYGLAKAFCRDYVPDRMSTFEVNDMVAKLYAVGTQNLDLLESMCQYMSTYNYAKMKRELRADVLCRSLHDLSLSPEATAKSKKLFEFAANDFDLARCGPGSLCELAKAMLRCKESTVDKKKVFVRLCSTRTAVDDPDVLVAIAMSGVWDSGYFEEAAQRQLKSKSKSAERCIYTLFAISYGMNFHIDSGWSDDTAPPPDVDTWTNMENWTTTFCRLQPFALADQLAQPSRLSQFSTLNLEALSSLLWALAGARIWNEKLILYTCAHLVNRLEGTKDGHDGSTVGQSLVRALWSLGMLNAPLMKFGKAVVALVHELDRRIDTLSPSDLVNLITALSVFVPTTLLKCHGGPELLNTACGKLVEALTGQLSKAYRPDWMATAAKSLYFARVVAQVPPSSGLTDASLSAILSSRKCGPLPRLSMKAATQLEVVCHGVKADGIQVKAMVLGLFPYDVFYAETKEVLEIERPNEFIRTVQGWASG
ncbi:hypothetical protein FOL47_010509 [Perkinsus chesapeaki]|uniref:Uncharacterized protein n=1 Tax=Perkinsus chesapeaki TaxID=330153 RepID=A0A7J6MQ62_PERCH|nr:hypothetical protein FOL47_010509 [Perkinsus chesapeaki]